MPGVIPWESGWQIYGDGQSRSIWREVGSGEIVVWEMNGTTLIYDWLPTASRSIQNLLRRSLRLGRKECRWVKPVVVRQFEFLEWTGDNHLRHSDLSRYGRTRTRVM